MVEWKCKFYDTENIDGYFSGILYLYTNDKRYIFSFGYDIEFETFKLMNCDNPLYNIGERYSNEEIADVYMENYVLLKNEMRLQTRI